MEGKAVWLVTITLIYRITLFAGIAYLVGWCDWSAWWFLFGLLIAGEASVVTEKRA